MTLCNASGFNSVSMHIATCVSLSTQIVLVALLVQHAAINLSGTIAVPGHLIKHVRSEDGLQTALD